MGVNLSNEKIIFLDIDGVLNVIPQGRDEYGAIFHKHFEENIKLIIEKTGAKIVISSTWRISGFPIMKEMWEKRGLTGEVVGITPNFMHQMGTTLCRGKEIQEFIDNHNVIRYVIIDDDSDMEDHQMEYFVKTSENRDHEDCVDDGYGLTLRCAEKAIDILNKPV